MELGSGTGLVAATAALLGGQVLATDTTSVLPVLSENVASHLSIACSKGGSVHAQVLDWSSIHAEDSLHPGHDFDFVVGADLVYSNVQIGPISQALGFLAGCAKKQLTIIIVHKTRDDSIEKSFLQCCAEKGVRFSLLEVDMAGFIQDPAGSGVLHVYQAVVDAI